MAVIMNIISRSTFTLLDVVEVSSYEISIDSDYGGKSTFVLPRKPTAEEDDFVIMHDDDTTFTGIIGTIESEYGYDSYTITALEMPTLFDENIVLTNTDLLATGIEDFIANQITGNFISSNDDLLNITYLTVAAKSHTPVAAKPDNENGVYNLCTYLGNAMTSYGIFIDFNFSTSGIEIAIEKKAQDNLDIDTGITDVTVANEVYSISALTKLTVLWDNGTASSTRQFFLKTDRTITEDIADPDRAKGSSNAIYSVAETEDEMIEEAQNQFTSNSYQHKVEFDVLRTSKLIPEGQLYVGHKCRAKTKNGIKDSMITGIIKVNNSSIISVTLGQLKITLIEKLKGVEAGK